MLTPLKRSADGAAVVFEGMVRDNSRGRRTLYLEYEAYEPMALRQMQALAEEARRRFSIDGVSIIHRVGRIEIGETSVLIVVSSAHRAAAFDACRWIIDTLKKTVPIWKKNTSRMEPYGLTASLSPENSAPHKTPWAKSLHPNECPGNKSKFARHKGALLALGIFLTRVGPMAAQSASQAALQSPSQSQSRAPSPPPAHRHRNHHQPRLT